jgi:hypothetical protein
MTGLVWPEGTRVYHKRITSLRGKAATIEADRNPGEKPKNVETFAPPSERDIKPWPQNGLRHSFASYHLAKHQNAAELALQMGHTSTKLIFSAYIELVSPEEAEKYWNIRPKASADNVIQMGAQQA